MNKPPAVAVTDCTKYPSIHKFTPELGVAVPEIFADPSSKSEVTTGVNGAAEPPIHAVAGNETQLGANVATSI